MADIMADIMEIRRSALSGTEVQPGGIIQAGTMYLDICIIIKLRAHAELAACSNTNISMHHD